MAKLEYEFDAIELAKDSIAYITIKNYHVYAMRIWIAARLLDAVEWLLGCKVEVKWCQRK